MLLRTCSAPKVPRVPRTSQNKAQVVIWFGDPVQAVSMQGICFNPQTVSLGPVHRFLLGISHFILFKI